MKRIIVSLLLIFTLVLSLVGCDMINSVKDKITEKVTEKVEDIVTDTVKEEAYKQAIAYLGEAKYEEAYAIFCELGDYKDAEMHLARFHYVVIKGNSKMVLSNGEEQFASAEIVLNDKGLPAKETGTDRGEPYEYDYVYDENGNLINELYQGKGYTRVYDENRNLIKLTHESVNGSMFSFEYTYDKNGNVIKEIYSSNDSSSSTYKTMVEYVYDEKNNVIRSTYTYYYSDGATPTDTVITNNSYDSNGNLITKVRSYQHGYVIDTRNYSYDNNGRLVKKSVYNNYGTSTETEYTYDNAGNIIEVNYTADFTSYKNSFTYDESGNLLKDVCVHGDGDVRTIEYEYDSHGNLTKMTDTYPDGDLETVNLEYKLVYIPIDMTEDEFMTIMDNIFNIYYLKPEATLD